MHKDRSIKPGFDFRDRIASPGGSGTSNINMDRGLSPQGSVSGMSVGHEFESPEMPLGADGLSYGGSARNRWVACVLMCVRVCVCACVCMYTCFGFGFSDVYVCSYA
jgi:hypothetical protein